LVIDVVERPSISSIEIEGNKAISTEDLMKGLKQSGLAEGEIFQRATLEGVRNELQRQYVAQGRYSATIETQVTPQPRNRVALKITVNEGT
ncbi:POTRA domain-containing protein, partial [Pseudomonas sp. HMSC75E02]